MTMQQPPSVTGQRPKKQSQWSRAWQWLTSPHPSVKDIGPRRQAQFSAGIALVLMVILLIGIASTLFMHAGQLSAGLFPLFGLFAILLIGYILDRTRNYRLGMSLLVWGFGAVGFFIIGAGSDDPSSALLLGLLPAYILASILLPLWELITLLVISMVILTTFDIPGISGGMLGTLLGNLITTGILLVTGVVFRNSLERQRLNELDVANQELKLAQMTLEQRVEERTGELRTATFKAARHASQLQAISDVAHTISLVTDIRSLLNSIASLISDRFGFYHVGIFLIDEAKEYAVLQAANSQGGRQMLERGHRLKIGEKGIVGYVTQHLEARIALDVGTDAVFFDNPDLPNTRSEMAVPLMVGTRLIGALDVQSTEAAAFTEEDVEVMHTLGDQVAIAIENARLFDETRRALDDAQNVYNRFVQREWEKITLERETRGYISSPAGVRVLSGALDYPEVLQAIQSGNLVVEAGEKASLAVPLKVRGETIGVLNIRTPDTGRTWNQDEIGAIQRIVDRAALALESVRLLAESERRDYRRRDRRERSSPVDAAPPQSGRVHVAVRV